MTSSVTSPEDVVNVALTRIGYHTRVVNLMDGTPASRAALGVYGQTRDAIFRSANWGFAEKIAPAVVSGTAAPFPWTVSYVYPADCIRLRSLFGATYAADVNDPLPVLYTVADSATGKVILTKIASATLVYTEQVTDMRKWDPLFTEALIEELGRVLAPVLASLDAAKLTAEGLKTTLPLAEVTLG